MTDFPRSPVILKGALVVYAHDAPSGAQPVRAVHFQYNPATMKRTLAAREAPEGGDEGADGAPTREQAGRVGGPPVETISFTAELHAADQLEAGDPVVEEHGLHTALAALELLLHPSLADERAVAEALERGEVQAANAPTPFVLLVWGKSRVVPVRLTGYSVSEEAFDTRLNPIHARADLTLQVVVAQELPDSHIGRDAYAAYRQQKESLAGKYDRAEVTAGLRALLPRGG